MSDLNSTQHLVLAVMARLPGWEWTRDGIEEELQTCSKPSRSFVRAAVQKLVEDGLIRFGEQIRLGQRKFKTFRKVNHADQD